MRVFKNTTAALAGYKAGRWSERGGVSRAVLEKFLGGVWDPLLTDRN